MNQMMMNDWTMLTMGGGMILTVLIVVAVVFALGYMVGRAR